MCVTLYKFYHEKWSYMYCYISLFWFHRRDDSVVKRATDNEAEDDFTGEGFRCVSVLTVEGSSHNRISQSRLEDTQVFRVKTGGVRQFT